MKAPATSSRSDRVDWTCAPGRPPATRAHAATYAASQPLSHASAVAADGANGATAAPVNATASSGAIAGAATALAGIATSDTAWNCIHITGAVAAAQAAETARPSAANDGTG